MAKIDLTKYSTDELRALRKEIDKQFERFHREWTSQLAVIDGADASKTRGVKKGTKVAAKYRGPDGETWTGRGNQPRWLRAFVKKGGKLDKLLIR